jgi:phosphoglycolate phosphatase
MYRYILFDLDGTLTDSKEGIVNCLKYAIEKFGDPIPPEETLLSFIGPPLKHSFGVLGYDEEKTELAIKAYRERYEPIGKYENKPVDGGVALCKKLKELGYQTAVASSKPRHMCTDICEKFGFAPYLDHIVGPSSHNNWTKSDVIREVLRLFGVDKDHLHEVLMVGDRMFDVHGAAECGIDCVGVEFFGYAAPGELKDAGAIAVVQTTEELEACILAH